MTSKSGLAYCMQFAYEAMRVVAAAAGKVHFQSDDKPQVYAIALHATIIEQFHSCIALVEANATTALPNTVRSVFEATVDLENLLQDRAYHQHMEASNLKQMIKLMSHADLPILKGLRDKHDIDTELVQHRERFEELKEAGFDQLHVRTKFERADRLDHYNTLYGLYCLDSHNNITALAERHFGSAEDAMTLFREMDEASVSARMTFSMECVIASAVMIHATFRTGDQSVLALKEQFIRERAGGSFDP
jgi:hypothetical protein